MTTRTHTPNYGFLICLGASCAFWAGVGALTYYLN